MRAPVPAASRCPLRTTSGRGGDCGRPYERKEMFPASRMPALHGMRSGGPGSRTRESGSLGGGFLRRGDRHCQVRKELGADDLFVFRTEGVEESEALIDLDAASF